MLKNSALLPTLSMGLIYCSISFGFIIINVRGSERGGEPSVLFHFVLAFLVALGIYRALRAGWKFLPRFLAVATALIGLFCIAIPFLPGELFTRLLNGRPPVIALSAGLFLPVGLTFFFRAVPAGREGFFYGLTMMIGESLWLVLFPLFGGDLRQAWA